MWVLALAAMGARQPLWAPTVEYNSPPMAKRLSSAQRPGLVASSDVTVAATASSAVRGGAFEMGRLGAARITPPAGPTGRTGGRVAGARGTHPPRGARSGGARADHVACDVTWVAAPARAGGRGGQSAETRCAGGVRGPAAGRCCDRRHHTQVSADTARATSKGESGQGRR